MKLVVEIVDFYYHNALEHNIDVRIMQRDNREGISTLDKSEQTERLARLIDLSKGVKKAVDDFYQKRTISLPSASISTSGEPGTK